MEQIDDCGYVLNEKDGPWMIKDLCVVQPGTVCANGPNDSKIRDKYCSLPYCP